MRKNGTPAGPDTVQSSVFPCTPPYPPAALQMYSHCEMSDGCETDICGIYFETAMRTVEPLLARGARQFEKGTEEARLCSTIGQQETL